MHRWLTAVCVLVLAMSIQGGDRDTLAAHDGHTIESYFMLQFIESPPATISVYD